MDFITIESMLTEERIEKIQKLVASRQLDLTIILENVHDPHNIGAVLRTCDSIGIAEIYAIYTIESSEKLFEAIGNKSSSGSKKWVDVHVFEDAQECIQTVRKKYKRIYGTHLATDSVGLYDLDMSDSIALMFGNEHRGICDTTLPLLDGNFIIPQVGMTKSLNISVACAVTLYEAMRQRIVAGKYDLPYDSENKQHQDLYKKYVVESKTYQFTVKRKGSRNKEKKE